MWRMKLTAVSLVVLGALLFGSVVAFAGWGWNAKVDVGGTKISTSWAVTDDTNGAADYTAEITLEVPSNVDVDVVKVAPRESLTPEQNDEVRTDGNISAVVTYIISSNGGDGEDATVSVDRVDGKYNYGFASGKVGEPIVVPVTIIGECNS